MGLKMPSDEDILASKIFLNRASVRNKAKSWLNVSSGAEVEQTLSSSLSNSSQKTAESDLNTIRASDELSGIGFVSKTGEDDPSNRQLIGANEALRRKLLSREAYKKYSEGKKHGADASRPASRKRESEEAQDEEGGKGKSSRQVMVKASGKDDGQKDEDVEDTLVSVPMISSRSKKRPSSYLDQLLADRKSRQQKKAKKSDSND